MRPSRHVLMTTDVVGGVWDFCCVLASQLVRCGHTVTMLAFGEPSPAQRGQATSTGAAFVAAPLKLEWMRDSEADVARARRLIAEIVDERAPAVLHANQYAPACAELPVPTVLTAHSDVLSWSGRATPDADRAAVRAEWRSYADLVRRALDGADEVVAVSHTVAGDLREFYDVHRRLEVIHNGWPELASVPRPVATRRALTVLAGRAWDSAKNVQLAVSAARGWNPGRVVLAGNQAHPETGASMPVSPPIEPLGYLSHDDLYGYLADARVFLAPARYEPFGLAPLQAALLGCPLLLSDIASFRELWDGAALFFPPDDPAALRRQWRRLLDDDVLASELACRARTRAVGRYGAARMATAYAAVYERVFAGRPAPRSGAAERARA